MRKRLAFVQIAADGCDNATCRAIDNIDYTAAFFIDVVVICNKSDFQLFAGFNKHLATNAPAVAVVGICSKIDNIYIAITLVIVSFKRDGDIVSNGTGDIRTRNDRVVIAIGKFSAAAEFILGRFGYNADDTSRRVFAEQG